MSKYISISNSTRVISLHRLQTKAAHFPLNIESRHVLRGDDGNCVYLTCLLDVEMDICGFRLLDSSAVI